MLLYMIMIMMIMIMTQYNDNKGCHDISLDRQTDRQADRQTNKHTVQRYHTRHSEQLSYETHISNTPYPTSNQTPPNSNAAHSTLTSSSTTSADLRTPPAPAAAAAAPAAPFSLEGKVKPDNFLPIRSQQSEHVRSPLMRLEEQPSHTTLPHVLDVRA